MTDKKDGFICTGEREWEETLDQLLTDVELRITIGKAGRKRIQQA
ncbi:glycosyltransferase [Crocinitomicaceae bacterium]|nr:glycosyltransferase [Crocinitomicaceae bacterium]MDC1186252.1 glycosyltransferase [Crocinitomicaceae bacterium]MDG1346698.1 glycosyltransferase [Crocinitomicaceae bacterium]